MGLNSQTAYLIAPIVGIKAEDVQIWKELSIISDFRTEQMLHIRAASCGRAAAIASMLSGMYHLRQMQGWTSLEYVHATHLTLGPV